MPKVSVIMSTYNDSNYINDSISSIMNQSFGDFEFIIIDDASTDDTVEKIKSFADDRIKLFINEKNQGLTKNLNKALRLVSGEYIARMDGDDISHEDRLKKQVEYLDSHKDVYLIGAAVHSFGATDLIWRLPDDSDELKIRMLIKPVFAHPSFMFRRSLAEEGFYYDESYRTAQDYDFASRVAAKHKIGRVQDILLEYRVHNKQISNKESSGQLSNADRVRQRLWDELGLELNENQIETMNVWVAEKKMPSIQGYKKAYPIITSMGKSNEISQCYNQEKLEITLKKMLYTWVIRSKSIKYIILFPYLCNGNIVNMKLFIGELIRTMKEKCKNA